MTSPSPFGPSPSDDSSRIANWLGRYLGVESDALKKLSSVLSDAADAIDEKFSKLFTPKNFSEQVKKSQTALVQTAIRKQVKDLFGDTANIIRNSQQDAAVAAVNAQLYDDRSILSQMFTNQTERDQYADSLKQTAKRNIDAVMTRVLETEKPLSQRVYHTQAIANGQVSQVINRALAKGESAQELADSVKTLIKPTVPGGVSYAAQRLARTEINNAFHAQSIHDAQEAPWTQNMEWNLSETHIVPDECNTYAEIKLFPVNQIPGKPHPNCRCFVTSVAIPYDQFENALISGQYNSYIDSVMGAGTSDDIAAKMDPGNYSISSPEEQIPPEMSTGKPRSAAQQKKNQIANARVQDVLPHARVVGFNDIGLDPKASKAFADQIEKLAKKYPDAARAIDSIGFGELEIPTAYGHTLPAKEIDPAMTKSGGRRSRHMLLGIDVSQDVSADKGFEPRFARDISSDNFHNPLPKGVTPMEQTVAHEFGHVIQFMFSGKEQLTWQNLSTYLEDAHRATHPPEERTLENFKKWVTDHLSGYSFQMDEYGEGIRDLQYRNLEEMISEAFGNVEIGGGNVVEKAVHEFLVDSYKEFYHVS